MFGRENTHMDESAQVKRHPIDERGKPEWGFAPDGRYVKIAQDARFDALWREWSADACAHPRKVIVRWSNAGGQIVHKRYCQDCGTALSNFIATADAEREGVSNVEKDRIASISNAYRSERGARLEQIANDAAERMQPNNRATYDDYLRSDQWKRKAALVLRRANYVCEGCLSRPATEVHHITYQNLHREFAWELRAVCAACHTRCHERGAV